MASILNVDEIKTASGTAAKIDVHGFSVAVIADQKANNVDAGTSSVGWNDRDLNTEIFDPDGIVSISSNQFTLGAGTYIIEFSAPAYRSGRHITQLYDVTNSTSVQDGSISYTHTTYAGFNHSFGSARVSITANTTYKIRHHCEASYATNGLGIKSTASGTVSIYTQVKITKLA